MNKCKEIVYYCPVHDEIIIDESNGDYETFYAKDSGCLYSIYGCKLIKLGEL